MVGPSPLNNNNSGDCRPHLTRSSPASNREPTAPLSNITASEINTLGEFIRLDTELYLKHGSWERLFHHVKGRTNFAPHLRRLPHQAMPLLSRYASSGVPIVLQSLPWSLSRKNADIARGNHPSVQAYEDFIRAEMEDMHSKGIFTVLPYGLLRAHPALHISPLGCVPQREQ